MLGEAGGMTRQAGAKRCPLDRNLHDAAQALPGCAGSVCPAGATGPRVGPRAGPGAARAARPRPAGRRLGAARPCALRVPAGAHGRDLVAAFESAAGRAALPVAVVGGDAGRFWPAKRQRSTSAVWRRSRTRPTTPARAPGEGDDRAAGGAPVATRRRPRRRVRPSRVQRGWHGFVNMSDRVGAMGRDARGRLGVGAGDGRVGRAPLGDRIPLSLGSSRAERGREWSGSSIRLKRGRDATP
jgi:hypothetical protein